MVINYNTLPEGAKVRVDMKDDESTCK